MSNVTRRQMITSGLAATAGVSSIAVAAHLADQYGLLPPDCGNLYRPGEVLTFASQRLLGSGSPAREFDSSQISKPPHANGKPLASENFKKLAANGFADWRLNIDGMVSRPLSLSLSELRGYSSRSQITHLACEEGWSFIAQWTGVPLSHILELAGASAKAKYVFYFSIQSRWWDSVDMSDAYHPQTLVTYGMNGEDLPVGHGGPLRLRVPRQLGYKSVKYITRLTVTDTLKGFGKGMGSSAAERGYAWYSGI